MSGTGEAVPGGTSSGTEGGTTRYSVPQVARLLNISERAVRKQIQTGKLKAERDGVRWLVLITEPRPEPIPEPRGTDRGTPSEPGGTDSEPIDAAYRVPAIDQGQRYLTELRDDWLAPLVQQLRELERNYGRLEAERDAERQRADAAEAALEHLQAPETNSVVDDDTRVLDNAAPEPLSRAWWDPRGWFP